MPDSLTALSALDGIEILIPAACVAGFVRGFSGFGTALVFLPFASQFLDPVKALIALVVMDILGPVPVARQAYRTADKPDLLRLVGAMLLALPLGVWILVHVPENLFRYGVSIGALAMLVILMTGLRLRKLPGAAGLCATGASGGLLGGAVGLPGPPVILVYLASPNPAHVIRATLLLYLFAFDLSLLGLFAGSGLLQPSSVGLGLVLAVPNVLGVLAGTAVFRPDYEKLYRALAYAIIALSALRGLPFWETL